MINENNTIKYGTFTFVTYLAFCALVDIQGINLIFGLLTLYFGYQWGKNFLTN